MDESTPEGKIMVVLKQELRAKGFQYREIASRLKVSQGTIKRYFTGKGVSLAVLRRLAEIADLDLLTLATLAEQQRVEERKFTKPQQAALGKDQFMSAIYFLLWHGWTPAQISKEFEVTDTLDSALAKLESLGLVRKLSQGVKILATPSFDQRGGGQLADLTRDFARRFLSEIDLSNQAMCEWTIYAARLSRSSVARLHNMINKFFEDTRALTVSDTTLPRDVVQWYRVFVGAEPVDRKTILRQS
jgi:transcriptional regulator with XRE-family HTH domain